jgi:pyruvate dehydrogenase E1 component alpha subunit
VETNQHLLDAQLIEDLRQMILIRQFEQRAESAYLSGHIGGFFHSYIGQEAIQTAATRALGHDHWWITSYRCHALALLLGATPKEIMAELFGRSTGNAMGRGGSMHLYTDQLLGGYGIVGGQIPIATGAAFSIKYQQQLGKLAICFLGDGAIAQGAFHESLTLASLWSLPCLYVIENNQWSMGTPLRKSVSIDPIAELKAKSFGIEGKTIDGMSYFELCKEFHSAKEYILEHQRPYLLEVKTERFKGHSISDPGLYRSKEELKACMQRDPIRLMSDQLKQLGLIQDEQIEQMQQEIKQIVLESIDYALASPWPETSCLEEGVFAL